MWRDTLPAKHPANWTNQGLRAASIMWGLKAINPWSVSVASAVGCASPACRDRHD